MESTARAESDFEENRNTAEASSTKTGDQASDPDGTKEKTQTTQNTAKKSTGSLKTKRLFWDLQKKWTFRKISIKN